MNTGKNYKRSVTVKKMIAVGQDTKPVFCNWSGSVEYVPFCDAGFDAHAVVAEGVQIGVLTCVESGKMNASQVKAKTIEMVRLWQRKIFLEGFNAA